jgi:hypothetical protein
MHKINHVAILFKSEKLTAQEKQSLISCGVEPTQLKLINFHYDSY